MPEKHLDRDLGIALDAMFFKAGGVLTQDSVKPLEDAVRARMTQVGGWILDTCKVTLTDVGEWIDVEVSNGKQTATRAIRIEDPATGEIAVRVDTNGDGF